ncbi:DUF4192 domain-containing protein [Actinosynnema sp. NPDC023587]|uniref:DUF4192 domain-containing protein n=1 Tax=Actinosynnema sp. NPDC023587 TaxID=3154695 RepID=UPI0033E8ACF6
MKTPTKPSHLRTPGDVIAALPYLLGFHPADSLVLLILEGGSIAQTLRLDLPVARNDRRVADELALSLRGRTHTHAVAVVVGGGRGDPPELLPREHLVTQLTASLGYVGVRVTCAAWSPATSKGSPWLSYHDLGDQGVVPDPATTTIAARAVAQGLVTHQSRETLAATLTPDPPEALARRSLLLDQTAAEARIHDTDDSETMIRQRDLVRTAVARTRYRTVPLTDAEVADLAFALSDPWVRDASLADAISEHAEGAERLWIELTRASPTPERAEPAALLAFSAYVRGDGALALMAMDRAEEAMPGHRLTVLLRTALENGMTPTTVRGLAERAAAAEWFPKPPPTPSPKPTPHNTHPTHPTAPEPPVP